MGKAEFLKLLETLIKAAMKNIVSVELILSDNEEIVLAACDSGAEYMINVTGDSHIAIAHDVIDYLRFK